MRRSTVDIPIENLSDVIQRIELHPDAPLSDWARSMVVLPILRRELQSLEKHRQDEQAFIRNLA